MMNHPTAELVAVHWLKTVGSLNPDLIATTVPARSDEFERDGFIQVTAVGGAPDVDTFMQNPMIQLDFWAYNAHSQKRPWGKANQLAMRVKKAVESSSRRLVLPKGFHSALVRQVIIVSDPRRVPDDAGFARYTMDTLMAWTELEKVT